MQMLAKLLIFSTDTEWISVAAGTTTVKISAQGSKSMLPDSEITINSFMMVLQV